jgi:epoxyqueuosine reductase
VCPWNERFARPGEEPAYAARAELDGAALVDLAGTLLEGDDAEFRERFRGSPLLRAKREGLLRNVCVALGNWGSEAAVPVLLRALGEENPLVRAHAAWALGRVGTDGSRAALSARLTGEPDGGVREELKVALRVRKPG